MFFYFTFCEVITRTIPIGINVKPIMKKTGRAVLAVMIGCHAGKRCCLNAVSNQNIILQRNPIFVEQTGWFFAFLLFIFFDVLRLT